MLYAIAWSRLHRDDLSEDVVQETFLQAYRYLPGLRDPSRLPGWMARIARNLAIRVSKRRSREHNAINAYGEEVALAQSREIAPSKERWDVSTALASIPEQYREALILYYVEEMNVRDCAALLHISETAFKTRLHRARTRLKDSLEATVESQLRTLAPRPDFKQRVMAAITAVPIAGKAPAAGFGGALSGWLLKLLFPMLQFAFTFAMVAAISARLAKNYTPDGGVRSRTLWRNYVVTAVAVGLSLVLTFTAVAHFGAKGVFEVMGVYILITAVCGLWQSSLTGSMFVRATSLANLGVGVTFVMVPLLNAHPMWLMQPFLVYNIMLYLVRKQRPCRQDYNLLLRASLGGIEADPQRYPAALNAARTDLDRFARFLGEQHLIVWQRRTHTGARFFLPPITPTGWYAMLPIPQLLPGVSWLDISFTGECRAHFSTRDIDSLRRVAPNAADAHSLAPAIELALDATLSQFLSGHDTAARKIVEKTPDDQVFERPPYELRSQKLMYTFSIGAGVLLLVLLVFFQETQRGQKFW